MLLARVSEASVQRDAGLVLHLYAAPRGVYESACWSFVKSGGNDTRKL